MTRVTDFRRKRTYVEAGFATSEQPGSTADGDQRRRTGGQETGGGDGQRPEENGAKEKKRGSRSARTAKKSGQDNSVAISGYKKRTEQRRLRRISDRAAETVCFACREKGHAAKDCPKAVGKGGDGHKNTNATVGICYRCGSTKHTLSRCKTARDSLNPLPFASCFVCSGKGHLASACPQNKEKGIYPNGGCCKLCGENTHLAKDCQLRKKDASGTAATTVFGTGRGAGADEDDFHTFKRKNAQVSKDEKKQVGRRKQLDAEAGVHTATVNTFPASGSTPKKVVFF